MSIAVRVSVWILAGLVAVSAAVAVLALMQKQTLQQQNQGLHNEISGDESKLADLTTQTKRLQDQAQDLNNKISQAQQDKSQIQSQYDDLKQKSDTLQAQLDQANSDRDDWKNRVDTITRERDSLMQKLRSQPVKIVYKTRVVKVPVPMAAPAADNAPTPGQIIEAPSAAPASGQSEEYWASILRQKAALQIEVEKEKYELNQAALQVADLKKQNSDLEVEVKEVSNEKDAIVQKIKYGQDLADNLSIDLARSRDDQEAVNERADKLSAQNMQLLSQIRDMSSNRVELERTIAHLTDEKDSMQKKLIETQSVIQSRIDDIWKIKQSLDRKLAENSSASSEGGSMELPPIIVNAPQQGQQEQEPQAQQQSSTATAQQPATSGKAQGTVISINDPNNFVITDLGQQNSSVNVGTTLKVYRDSTPIATLEVIQVRRDICAADIKDKSAELQVGDVVRFE